MCLLGLRLVLSYCKGFLTQHICVYQILRFVLSYCEGQVLTQHTLSCTPGLSVEEKEEEERKEQEIRMQKEIDEREEIERKELEENQLRKTQQEEWVRIIFMCYFILCFHFISSFIFLIYNIFIQIINGIN